jgi:hypothetical protein
MWQYGMRVVFTRAWVDQERTPHNYLKDFQSELPLYLRAGGLVNFLRAWAPSSATLSLRAQYEELLIALYEHDVLDIADVQLGQAWLADLADAGYAFPSRASHGLYDAWATRRSAKDGAAGTAIVLLSENREAVNSTLAVATALRGALRSLALSQSVIAFEAFGDPHARASLRRSQLESALPNGVDLEVYRVEVREGVRSFIAGVGILHAWLVVGRE